VGVKVRAGAEYGESAEPRETAGAPFFFKAEEKYFCVFHSRGAHLLESGDGVHYARRINEQGTSRILADLGRDAMVLRIGRKYFFYFTVTTKSQDNWLRSFVILRTTEDFRKWSDYTVVSEGGVAGSGPVNAESPFVVALDGYYYLFRATSIDPMTYVYRSTTPYHFGCNDDSKLIAVLSIKAPEIVLHDGQYYITDLADFQGLKMARLGWAEDAPR
jgi:hypothetical protein